MRKSKPNQVKRTKKESSMPPRLPGDHPTVLHLCNEAERLNGMATRWLKAKPSNPYTITHCQLCGWAFAMVAAHLRCWFAGELISQPPALMLRERSK